MQIIETHFHDKNYKYAKAETDKEKSCLHFFRDRFIRKSYNRHNKRSYWRYLEAKPFREVLDSISHYKPATQSRIIRTLYAIYRGNTSHAGDEKDMLLDLYKFSAEMEKAENEKKPLKGPTNIIVLSAAKAYFKF